MERLPASRQVKKKNLFDPALAGELFFFSGMKYNFRNLFAVLNFWFFSFKRKEHKK
jgi:hypothetical protein